MQRLSRRAGHTLFGFVGGEKQAFLADPDVVDALGGYGLELDARVAGSVEMVREAALLSQKPQFLWPSSSIMVDLARQSGVGHPQRSGRAQLADRGLHMGAGGRGPGKEQAGDDVAAKGGYHQLDLKALLDAVLAGKTWSALGVDELYGRARIVSTDPNRSNSGFMFAGLVLSLLARRRGDAWS